MKHISGLIGVMLLGSLFNPNALAQAEPPAPAISYDQKTDALSVTAKDASYKEVMSQVATLTGIEILMDPKAEHRLTTSLSKTPLEKALKDLSRETSVAFVYSETIPDKKDKTATPKTIITSMQILPKGDAGIGNLRPLLTPGGEAFIREKNRSIPADKQPKIFDLAQQRWDARLKNMPADKREKLLADAKEKMEQVNKRQDEKKQVHEQRQKQRQQRDQQRETERQAHLESLKTSNPGLYEIKMKQYEAAKQAMKQPPPNK